MLRKLVQTGVPSIQWPMALHIPGRYTSTPLIPHRFLLLLLIVLVALLLRLWALDRVPPPLWQDEVSLGYNAYSILHTSRDEYGVAWPLSIRGYGTFHVPLYTYMTIPSVAIFGLTPIGVRLPSALAGTLSVAVMYAVAVQLLRNWRLGICAAAFLAVSPWHLQFCRGTWEQTVLLLAVLVMAAALLTAFHKPPGQGGYLYCTASLAFLCGVYAYAAGPVFLPFLLIVLLRAYWSRVARAPRRWLIAAGFILTVGLTPFALQFAEGDFRVRYRQVSAISSPQVLALSRWRTERDGQSLLHHPQILALRQAVDAYLSHFNPTFLFTRGDANGRHRAGDHAQLYLWDLPLVLAGLALVLKRWGQPAMQVIGGWLLLGPLPATFAAEAPHALRTLVMLPAWYLVAVVGLLPLWRWLRRHGYGWDWLLLLVFSVTFYLYTYHHHYPVEYDDWFQSGWLETFAAAQVAIDAGSHRQVVMPADLPLPGAGYAHALFATAYDPHRYLAQGGSNQDSDQRVFEPFVVRKVDWEHEPRDPEVLYVQAPRRRLPPGARVVAEITSVSGRDVFRLIDFPSDSTGATTAPHSAGSLPNAARG